MSFILKLFGATQPHPTPPEEDDHLSSESDEEVDGFVSVAPHVPTKRRAASKKRHRKRLAGNKKG